VHPRTEPGSTVLRRRARGQEGEAPSARRGVRRGGEKSLGIGSGARARASADEYDRSVLWTALILLTFGLVMVYSASIATAEAARYTNHQPAYFLVRQAAAIGVALFAAALAFQVPMRAWQRAAPWLFVLGVAALALVLIPGLGREVNGARRWLAFPGFNLQPSEFVKIAAVLYAADYTARKTAVMHSFRDGLLPMLGVMLVVGWLLLREPDFGAFVVVAVDATGILFVGGMNVGWFLGLLALMLAGFAALVLSSPYRMQRIFGFMDPWSDAYGQGYQLSHALIAFGRGEWFGVGLGGSVEKLFYLPEAHTDFLLAVIGEELGFAGVLVVVGLFAWLVMRAFAIGRQAAALERPFAALVAQGIAIWMGVQAFINMGVNLGVLPTKGLTLPFMSFGGTAILANCVALALLLRIDWENRQLMRGQQT
jgi:cell division protein FtsW